MAVALAVTLEEIRQAARLEVTGVPAGADTYTITRTAPSGNTAGVRGATNATVFSPATTVRDYELPFDTLVTYTVTVYDGTTVVGTATAEFEISWDECEAWLVDIARPTNSLPVEIESMRELAYAAATGIHHVLDRHAPVLTTLPAWTPETELIILTDTLSERDQVRNLLGAGYPFLLRSTPRFGIGNIYFGLTEFVEERFLTPGESPQRRFRLACVQVERPDPTVFAPVPPNTYTNVKATYATYTALKAGVGTYNELAYIYPGGTSAVLPWPPDDI